MGKSRKFDLVIFDMDGTLTEVRSPWQYIHERVGVWEGLADKHLSSWLKGRIDYEEFFRLDVELWFGQSRSVLHGHLDSIPIKPGVPETLRALEEAGTRTAILSTGFNHVSERIQERCGFSVRTWANAMRFDSEDRLISVEMNTSGDEASPLSKRALAPMIMETFGAQRERTAAVGDTDGDLGMFAEAGLSLAVHEAPDLNADVVLPVPDIRSCLELLL